MRACHASACSRPTQCDCSSRGVADEAVSRGNATRHAPWADRSMTEIERRDWCCASIACRRGYLTRGQATVLQGGAALPLASCTPYDGDTGPAAHRCSVGRRGALSDRRTQRVWPTPSIRATHWCGLRTSCPRLAPSAPGAPGAEGGENGGSGVPRDRGALRVFHGPFPSSFRP